MGKKRLLLTFLLVAAACRTPAADDGQASSRAEVPGVKLARLPDSQLGDSAAVAGTLQVQGSCLYLEAAGSARYLIAFTLPGVQWDAALERLVAPAGEAEKGRGAVFRAGEKVTLGGSEASSAIPADSWVEPPAETCDTRRIWIAHSIASASSASGVN